MNIINEYNKKRNMLNLEFIVNVISVISFFVVPASVIQLYKYEAVQGIERVFLQKKVMMIKLFFAFLLTTYIIIIFTTIYTLKIS